MVCHPLLGEEGLDLVDGFVSKTNDFLAGLGQIDEVALMPRDHWASRGIPGMVGHPGFEYFNQTTDTVRHLPLAGQYQAQYHFLRTPYPWRIEIVRIVDGFSPVHQALNEFVYKVSQSEVPVVHFSFKVPDTSAYEGLFRTLFGMGCRPVQLCRSDYGRFGYWRAPVFGGLMAYLKPRVNLRDSGLTT